jgi:hypothetical protein
MALDGNLEKEELIFMNRWFVKQQNFKGRVFLSARPRRSETDE